MNTTTSLRASAVVRITLLLFAAATLTNAHAAPPEAAAAPQMLQPDRQVTYSTAENSQGEAVALQLHVFLPEGWQAEDQRPAAVFFFGGGWNGGTPSQFYPFCQQLAARGMVCAAAEYRVKSRDGTPPTACVEDGRAAVAFLREHAGQWGIDPNRIAAGGGSAGGHVAAATGILPSNNATTKPNLLLLYNPVIDTSDKGYGRKQLGVNWQALSPLHHVAAHQPPTLICHGTADTTTPFAGVEAFHKAMLAADNECTVVPFEGRKHGFFNSPAFKRSLDGKDYAATLEATIDFLTAQKWLSLVENEE